MTNSRNASICPHGAISAADREPTPETIATLMAAAGQTPSGGPSAAFLCDPDYRAPFLSLIRGIDRGDDPLFYGAPIVMLFHTSSTIPTPEEDAALVVGYPVRRRVRPVVRRALPMTRAA